MKLSLFRRLRSPSAIGTAISLCVVATLLLLRGYMAWKARTTFSVDEGYFGAFALALDGGGALPYVDAVSQRGPILYWLIYLFQKAAGLYAWSGIHWLSVAAATSTAVALYLAGRFAQRPFAGALAALLTSVLTTVMLPTADGIALTGEAVAVAFLTAALALQGAGGVARRPAGPFFFAGCCVSLAALTKQTAAFAAPAFLVWALFQAASRRQFLASLAGLATPAVVILGVYGWRNALPDFVYWTVT